jgi:hypothetical protein
MYSGSARTLENTVLDVLQPYVSSMVVRDKATNTAVLGVVGMPTCLKELTTRGHKFKNK